MKIQVITSCTGEKLHSNDRQLTRGDFEHLHEPEIFGAREEELRNLSTPAEDLYTGQQHLRLMNGIRQLRDKSGEDSVDLFILSAGYGLVLGGRRLAPYECTFQGMKTAELKGWAEHLRVNADARQVFATPADLTLVLLGDSYLRALSLSEEIEFASPTLFFASEKARAHVRGRGIIRVVPLSNREAKRFSCGLVGLKGELGRRMLGQIGAHGKAFIADLFEPAADVLSLLESEIQAPQKKSKTARPNPEVDHVIRIPNSWWQKPHREKLMYFIPEWDDLVDPDYDFGRDIHSGGVGDWSNEVYAHQMYPEPNYDGILISKVVAEKSKGKKKRINDLGVHRFLRVPREFPIMGDCGAFGYIQKEVPPYTTSEILDYYTRLDFDYGVSIDHLIVTSTQSQRESRYELTINNADEFLKEHKRRGLQWVPIGAVQGWDPKSYAEAARRYVAMGYKYIALGGLVRTSTPEILRVLEAVHQVVPATVSVHLFGLARIRALGDFAKLGVRSVDSASFLRRAWMGTGQNYLTLEGSMYAAIRIPEAGKSFRAKRMVSESRAAAGKVEKLEAACLRAVRDYDAGRMSVEAALDVIEEYDRLITPDRNDTRPLLRRTLEAMPWKECPCDICRRDGVEVIIFRGNNRNRRRGFHNTYTFYRIIQKVLAGEDVNFGWERGGADTLQPSLFPSVELAV
jgi:hypothetical protein